MHAPPCPPQVAAVGAKVGTKLKGLTPDDVAGLTALSRQLQDTLVPTHHVLMQLHVSTLKTLFSRDLRGESLGGGTGSKGLIGRQRGGY